MRRWESCRVVAAFALALGAGCSVPPGVAITVKTDKATTMVEVFVGNEPAENCGSQPASCAIGPPTAIASSNGRIYVGSGWTTRATAADRATVTGGVAHFQIQVDDGTEETQAVPTVILVGYDAAGTAISVGVLHDLDVPARDSVEIRATLEMAMPITAPASVGERVQVWRQPGDATAALAACVVVGHADSTIEFATPSADTDCDGALPVQTPPGGECTTYSGWNYCGQYPARLADTTCVIPTATNGCRLAGVPCFDAGGTCAVGPPVGTCLPTGEIACLAPDACPRPGIGCSTWDPSCLNTPLAASLAPRAACSFVFAAGMTTPCGGWPVLTINNATADDVLNGRSCTATAFVSVTNPIHIGLSVPLGTAGDSVVLVPNGDPCAPEVHLVGTANVDNNTLLDIVSGPSQQQHRMIPIHLSSQMGLSACNSIVSTCTLPPPQGYTFTCP